MYELEIQKYLRSGKTVQDLQNDYGINSKSHKDYPNLIQFKYDQIASDKYKHLEIVKECRSIILDASNNWSIVAFPFRRFYNLGEPTADKIDWESARIQEKLDGSIIIVYFYDGKWHCATSGMPDAAGRVNNGNMTFAELFWETAKNITEDCYTKETVYHLFKDDYSALETITFMFELTSPYNRNVVKYTQSSLHLIGMRDILTGEEISVTDHDLAPKQYDFGSVDGNFLRNHADTLSGTEHEGFVVVDKNFNRVKIKGKDYLLLDKVKSSFSIKNLLEIIISGEASEFLAYKDAFPEWAKYFDAVQEKLDSEIKSTEEFYETIKHIPVQKDFALQAVKNKYSGILFGIRAGKHKTFKEAFYSMSAEKLYELSNMKDISCGQ